MKTRKEHDARVRRAGHRLIRAALSFAQTYRKLKVGQNYYPAFEKLADAAFGFNDVCEEASAK